MSEESEFLPSRLSQLQAINARCNRFEAAWKSGNRPMIEEYLDSSPDDPALLQHLIALDIDYRRQRGESPQPEDYLDRFPALQRDWLLSALCDPTDAASNRAAPHDRQAMGISVSVFLDRLAARGLLSESAQAALRDQLANLTAGAIANLLVAEGKIQPYQARALLAPVAAPLVLGPYVLDGWIASGGMGDVFRATHRQMKRIVALKIMHGPAANPAALRERFQREVEVAARLDHPNIIAAFDAGEQDGVAYLVTEFVDGEDLDRLVKRGGPLSAQRALDVIRQAALGLAHAHARRIVHRDVKPSNLLLGRDGVLRVLDVGLARGLGDSSAGTSAAAELTSVAGLTTPGGLMGTVDFMAPEQANDPRRADERSDVYSLGCTLYYLLIGRPPYPGPGVYARLLAHRKAPIPSVRTVRPELSARLDTLLQQMLAKKPEQRFASMKALLTALDADESGPKPRLRRRSLFAATGIVAILAVIGYLFSLTGRSDPLPTPPRVPFDARLEQERWAKALGVPIEMHNAAGMRMVLIPPGAFVMGGAPEQVRKLVGPGLPPEHAAFLETEQQREVIVDAPFYLAVTEATVGQFRRFAEAEKYVTLAEKAERDEEAGWGWHPREGWRQKQGCSWKDADQMALKDDHPAGNISLLDAQAFCRWLTVQTGTVCRLPTEAEWEFACRAGSAGLWCFGDEPAQLPLFACAEGERLSIPRQVALGRANAFGLFDMHGNQHEWCSALDPLPERERRILGQLGPWAVAYQPLRGGNFMSPAERTRCGARHWDHSNSFTAGFRVMQTIPNK